MSSLPARSEDQLGPAERQQLEAAHRRLRQSVTAYQEYMDREVDQGEPIPVDHAEQVAEAQTAVEEAERELWRLREQLLGWERPPWAPGATLVADWFSKDDAVYDDMDSGLTR